ncbi:EKC/KEOPS complex subunit LAGE3-like [Dasypus novemcinctus]|uniref:EKC/KEOPS complex subunit LAGE3-like n=1 Tax=Dasypus novemcinctus TaxID=9361 RepID=UPI00265FEFC1|nr:EKC/KEOPS complex subunit LAGE3-like [Dasypus novemcinctus]
MGDADRHEEPVGADDQGDPSGPDGQGGPGRPVCQSIPADSEGSGVASGPGSPCDPCGAGAEVAAAGGAPQAARAPRAPGTLVVPFGSALQAEMAFRSLMPDIHRQGQAVQRITVNGSVLAVRWSAQDLGILRISINALLNDLSLIMRNIQRIAPLFPRSLSWEKRPET